MGLPDGPVADLACGPSGSALPAARAARRSQGLNSGLPDREGRTARTGDIAIPLSNLASICRALGQTDEAVPLAERARQIRQGR
jgi:hypothetical protein